MILIGLTGTAGSGKDTVADMLVKDFDLVNLSTSDFVRAITRHIFGISQDISPVRDQLYEVANYVRNEIDMAAIVKLCLLMGQENGVERALISGLRWEAEADAIRQKGGFIIGVDADPKIRYDRIFSRQRDTESQKSYEQFVEQDAYENRGLADDGPKSGIASIIRQADIVISNNGTLQDLEAELQTKVKARLHEHIGSK